MTQVGSSFVLCLKQDAPGKLFSRPKLYYSKDQQVLNFNMGPVFLFKGQKSVFTLQGERGGGGPNLYLFGKDIMKEGRGGEMKELELVVASVEKVLGKKGKIYKRGYFGEVRAI